jgi:tetraacyldisaccharide 4'-kinase
MREPAFWWQPGTGSLLEPLAAIYGAVAASRFKTKGQSAGLPVICLGNFTIGGGGKTPAALAVAQILAGAGARPFFLSRGYGGKLAGPVRVDPAIHNASDVGDEPLLLARVAPTIVARDRAAGAKLAHSSGASVIVMDDGFQNPTLAKDLTVVLIDGHRGIGNGRVIPAGPLRAPFDIQMTSAQAIIIVGPTGGATMVIDAARGKGVRIFHGRLEPNREALAHGGRVIAFAGIANPDKFFATLVETGISVAERVSFPDHHRYTAADAKSLMARAAAANLSLITTEKDHVRLAGDPALEALAARTAALPVRLVIDEESFRQMILDVIA